MECREDTGWNREFGANALDLETQWIARTGDQVQCKAEAQGSEGVQGTGASPGACKGNAGKNPHQSRPQQRGLELQFHSQLQAACSGSQRKPAVRPLEAKTLLIWGCLQNPGKDSS